MKERGQPVLFAQPCSIDGAHMARFERGHRVITVRAIVIVLKNSFAADIGNRERTFSLTPCKKRQNDNLGGCCGFAFHATGETRLGLHLPLFRFEGFDEGFGKFEETGLLHAAS